MHLTRFLAIAGTFVLSLAVNTTQAQTTFDVTVLAGACANCHGTDGRSPGAIPSLAGRSESVLRSQMLAYKSDAYPSNTTIMNRLAKGYSDEEINALALYFSQMTPTLSVSKTRDK